LYKRLGGHQSRSEHYGEKEHFLPLSRIEPGFLGGPPRSLVATSIELFRLPLKHCEVITYTRRKLRKKEEGGREKVAKVGGMSIRWESKRKKEMKKAAP
jgi:hypothetical protein